MAHMLGGRTLMSALYSPWIPLHRTEIEIAARQPAERWKYMMRYGLGGVRSRSGSVSDKRDP